MYAMDYAKFYKNSIQIICKFISSEHCYRQGRNTTGKLQLLPASPTEEDAVAGLLRVAASFAPPRFIVHRANTNYTYIIIYYHTTITVKATASHRQQWHVRGRARWRGTTGPSVPDSLPVRTSACRQRSRSRVETSLRGTRVDNHSDMPPPLRGMLAVAGRADN